MRGRRKAEASFECPHCGERVRAGALACPACGSDARTGWSDESDEDSAGTEELSADADFDYEAFLAREGLGGRRARRSRARRVLAGVVLLVLVAWLLRLAGC